MAKKQLVVSGLVSLFLGLIIYLALNHNTYVSKMIVSFFHIKPLNIPPSFITQILKNWGADFFWMLSFTLLVQSILELDERRYFRLMFCMLLGVLYETLQYVELVSGTADIGDVLAYALGSFVAIIIMKLHMEEKNMIKRKSILLIALSIVFVVFALGSGSGESTRDSVKVDSDKKSDIKYEISDTGFEYYTNSIGSVEYYGYVELKNTGDCDIYLNDCKFDLEDNDGHLLQSDSLISSCPKVISPGEKGYFYNGVGSTYIDKDVSFENGIKLVPQMKLKKATKKPASYPVSDVSVSNGEFGSIKVTGRVENTSDKDISYLYLSIIFYGADGKVLAIKGTSVTDIGAGMKGSFDTSTLFANDNLKLENISETKVIAEETYLQW